MSWIYEGNLLEEVDSSYIGFVYLITNKLNGRQYIGKKLLNFKKTKVVKGKKKKFTVESDWKSYYGSSEELKADITLYGEDNFERKILKFCKSKGECSYYEAKYQFEYDVLLETDKFYNSWISVRVRRSHLVKKT
jgi:hypothetical protein